MTNNTDKSDKEGQAKRMRHKWNSKRARTFCNKCGATRDKSHIPPLYYDSYGNRSIDGAPECTGFDPFKKKFPLPVTNFQSKQAQP